jgi:hypothetical protein
VGIVKAYLSWDISQTAQYINSSSSIISTISCVATVIASIVHREQDTASIVEINLDGYSCQILDITGSLAGKGR